MKLQAQNYSKAVRDQYEDYPYPLRNPEDERNRLLTTSSAQLDAATTYGFGGRLDLSKPFNVLVAGGGTGDGVIFLGEQLRPFPYAKITYLDISQASMEIAKKRAEIRGLTNIAWAHGSILDVGKLPIPPFDFIECTGVLHHMESPLNGLKALAAVLKPEGAMAVMLYGKYGRAGVYMMQEAMRQFAPLDAKPQQQVELCKRLIETVNGKNTPIINAMKAAKQEIDDNKDVAIYDLFLHSQDVSYTVSEVYALAASANLTLTSFAGTYGEGGRMVYDPSLYIGDTQLLREVHTLPLVNQQAIAEVLHGKMTRHAFYLTHRKPADIDIGSDRLIPSLSIASPADTMDKLSYTIQNSRGVFHIEVPPYGAKVSVNITPNLGALCAQIDGKRTLAQIYEAVMVQVPEATKQSLQQQLVPLLSLLNTLELMYFRYEGSPLFSLPESKNAKPRDAKA